MKKELEFSYPGDEEDEGSSLEKEEMSGTDGQEGDTDVSISETEEDEDEGVGDGTMHRADGDPMSGK